MAGRAWEVADSPLALSFSFMTAIPECKILILGHGGVGKSAMAIRLVRLCASMSRGQADDARFFLGSDASTTQLSRMHSARSLCL